ncbi:MAG: glycine--tRNA ligase subunit beta [Oceanicaulis sp.]|nr:glycine--tRNA ligase subunit beta [Oceanicaulis sp.]
MADLLIEFFCEEIPARMQARAEADLARLVSAALKDAGLSWDQLTAFSGPRRIGLAIEGLPLKTQAVREERKGPRTDAPEKAIEGFLRGAGLSSLDQCSVREDKKGSFYIAVIETPGRDTAQVLKTALPEIARSFPWPKSMKFGEGARAQRWVRPLHSLICLLGDEVVPVEVFGLTASNITQGHRIHGSAPFAVTGYADYAQKLKANGVILTRAERRQTILDGARSVCAKAGLELIEDEGLLDEVTRLAEQPVAVIGDMDTGFLDLPPEVITLTMRTHQKYFAVRDPKTGALAPKFVTIANQTAPDGGAAIAAGNARVLSARLSDARHFWDLDRAKGLDAMAGELSKVTFHDKLGTVADKTARVAALARELAPAVGADPDLAELAAKLAKADLVSQMVYEFPELQGVMGRYLALADAPPLGPTGHSPRKRGETSEGDLSSPVYGGGVREADGGGMLATLSASDRQQVADAIRDHYKPQGPSDAVPTAPVSAAVALADKLDTLVGFWAIDEKPTGSKDPFALRRAALGVTRIVLQGRYRLPLSKAIQNHALQIASQFSGMHHDLRGIANLDWNGTPELQQLLEWLNGAPFTFILTFDGLLQDWLASFGKGNSEEPSDAGVRLWNRLDSRLREIGHTDPNPQNTPDVIAALDAFTSNLLAFFADRLKVHLKDEGIRHDVIDAVFALGDDDLVRVTSKSRVLQAFLDTPDGAALLAGYRRAANILKAEEKKDGTIYGGAVNKVDFVEPEAKSLCEAVMIAEPAARTAAEKGDFPAAMSALAQLRGPVDAFFEAVVVNDKDPIVRRNRLVLLSRIRAAADAVADFSRLEG